MIKNGITVIVSVAVTLLVLEMALWQGGFRPDYTGNQAIDALSPALWWVCDETGCRFDRNHIADYYSLAEKLNLSGTSFYKRHRLVNSQGFHDENEFIYSRKLENAFRILVLGDSFTWGASADLGCSWVEIVKKGLADRGRVILWNAAIPATGTKQALATLKRFSEIMKPNLVLLGFHVNDFLDNLYPLDQYFRRMDGLAIVQYKLDLDFIPWKLSPQEAYKRALGIEPAQWVSPLHYFLGRFRWWTLLRRGTNQVLADVKGRANQADAGTDIWRQKTREIIWMRERQETERLLQEINTYAQAKGAGLLILLIPEETDLLKISREYQSARDIMRRLNLDFVDILEELNFDDYDHVFPDPHWQNRGHAKAGKAMLDRLVAVVGIGTRKGKLLKSKAGGSQEAVRNNSPLQE